MAAQYNVGDFVIFQGNMCVIDGIHQPLGSYHTFRLSDAVNGRVYYASKQEISHCELAEVVDFDVSFEAETTVPLKNTKPPSRFVKVAEQDIRNLADSRLEKSTKKQSAWAVKILRGRFLMESCYTESPSVPPTQYTRAAQCQCQHEDGAGNVLFWLAGAGSQHHGSGEHKQWQLNNGQWIIESLSYLHDPESYMRSSLIFHSNWEFRMVLVMQTLQTLLSHDCCVTACMLSSWTEAVCVVTCDPF